MMRNGGEIIVRDIRMESHGPVSRVTASVNGSPLWFESSDASLSTAPEAFGSALLLASLHHNRRLVIDSTVDDAWLENIHRLVSIWSEWWGYEPLIPSVAGSDKSGEPNPRTALAFSGGVDSFFSLIAGDRPDVLVAIQGFDIPLGDDFRMRAFEDSLRAVADAVGSGVVLVRTNLREHPALGRPKLWERAHGGALAAVGHLLGDSFGEFTISSTFSTADPRPWGSTPETDRLFGNSLVRIRHFGTHANREGKMCVIAGNALAQRHLRVCWENLSPSGNCSRCGKCVLTMLLIAEQGMLERFVVFEGSSDLLSRIEALPYLTHLLTAERLVERGRLEPRLAEALRKLVKRSRKTAKMRSYVTRIREAVAPHV